MRPAADPADAVSSDVDSLSDSDWQDIASNRASDDEDGFVSDRDGTLSLPPSSRRSSISLGSSRGGDVDAWEGIADQDTDAAPDAAPVDAHDDNAGAAPQEAGDPAEDQRVIEALDQSMVSTLNSSRTGSASRVSTVHSSHRDLRLSFPDPLAGSGEALASHLDSSYEGIAEPDDDNRSVASSVEERLQGPDAALTPEALSPDADPECPFESPSRQLSFSHHSDSSVDFVIEETHELKEAPAIAAPQVELYMYGIRMPERWYFIDRLVNKLAAGQTSQLSNPPDIVDETTRVYALEHSEHGNDRVVSRIAVHDRTSVDENADTKFDDSYNGLPSLAIVFLPSYPEPTPKVNVPQHKYYHFVTDGKKFPKTFHWFAYGQLLPHLRCRTSIDDVSDLDATSVAQAFEALLIDKPHSLIPAGFGRAFTLLAILTIILGVAVGYQSAQSVQRTAPVAQVQKTLMGLWAGSTNHTMLSPASYSAITSVREAVAQQALPSTLPPGVQPSTAWSHLAVPAIAIASSSNVASSSSSAIASSSSSATSSLSSASTFSLSTVPTLSGFSYPFLSAKAAGKRPATTDVAVRIPGTLAISPTSLLSESTATAGFGLRLEELVGAVQRDVRDASTVLTQAFEDVSETLSDVGNVVDERLREKRDLILRGTNSLVRAGQEHFASRNEKAKGRARHLKEQGLRLVSDAQEHLWDRVAMARRRARAMKENVA
ncbi:hypothetical protein K523DRAFT_261481, partial [Schizophyllum commune Tattone D]